MKRMQSNRHKIIKRILLTAGLLILGAVLGLELLGVPRIFHSGVRRVLMGRGLNIQFRSLRVGFVAGIRLDDAVVFDGGHKDAPAMLQAERVQLRTGPTGWLPGRFRPRSLNIVNGTLHLPLNLGAGHCSEKGNSLELNMLELKAVWRGNQLHFSRLNAELCGMELTGEAIVHNLPEPTTQAGVFGWDLIPAAQREHMQEQLRMIKAFCRQQRFGRAAQFNLHGLLELDWRYPQDFSFNGELTVTGLVYQGLIWQRLQGSVRVSEGVWQGENLQIIIGDNSARGHLAFDPAADDLSLLFAGRARLPVVYQLLNLPMPQEAARIRLPTPVRFELAFQGPISNPAAGRLQAQVVGRNLFYRDLFLRQLSGSITYHDRQLELADFVVQPVGRLGGSGLVTGHGIYHIDNARFSGQWRGRLAPPVIKQLLHDFQWSQQWLEDFKFSTQPATFALEFLDSSLAPAAWHGRLAVAGQDFKFRQLKVESLTADLLIDHGTITTHNPARLKLSTAEEGLDLDFSLNWSQNLVSGHARGALDLVRVYQALQLPSAYAIGQLELRGPPPSFDLVLAPSPLSRPREWIVEGEINSKKVVYEGLEMDAISGQVRMAEERLRFENIAVESPRFEHLSIGYLQIGLTAPIDLRMNVRFIGDPLVIDVFIDRGRSRRDYHQVWGDFSWLDQPPRIQVDRLHYQQYPDGRTRWALALEGALEAENVAYQGIEADLLSARVELALPRRAEVMDIAIRNHNGQELYGRIEFELIQNPLWRFECRGTLDPRYIFAGMGARTQQALSLFDFHPETDVEMAGTVHMRGGGAATLSSRFRGPRFSFYNLEFQEFDLSWFLAGADLHWDLSESRMHDGKVMIGGTFNTFTGVGSANLALDQVSVAGLAADLGAESATDNLGNLNSTARVDFRQTPDHSRLQIVGNGQLRIEDARLWEVPLLKNLGDVIGLGSLGRITQVEGDLEFLGDRARIKSLETDGTIISLDARGYYYWNRNYIDLTARGRTLRRTALLGQILRPLSWLFEARLRGELSEAEWSAVPLGGLR